MGSRSKRVRKGAVIALAGAGLVLTAGAQASDPVDQTAQQTDETLSERAFEAPKPDFKKGKKKAEAPPGAPGQPGGGGKDGDQPARANLTVKIAGLKGGKIPAGKRIRAIGRINPFVVGQRVGLRLKRNGRTLKVGSSRIKPAEGNKGRFTMKSPKLLKPGRYNFIVRKKRTDKQLGGKTRSKRAGILYPDLNPGQSGGSVKLLRRLLKKQGYYAPGGSRYDSHLERAVLAFRKVNRMSWSNDANRKIFKRLAKGKGAFKLKHPGAGHHVEVDYSRQVMVLASKRKARHTFHVSTGAAATPSDYGTFRFYRRDPGYNSIGMYYSVYYNRGEATHGYHSVPNYPASHGCIRNPIPDSIFIYKWIDLGDKMIVYR